MGGHFTLDEETDCEEVNWIKETQKRIQWYVFVMSNKCKILMKAGSSLNSCVCFCMYISAIYLMSHTTVCCKCSTMLFSEAVVTFATTIAVLSNVSATCSVLSAFCPLSGKRACHSHC